MNGVRKEISLRAIRKCANGMRIELPSTHLE